MVGSADVIGDFVPDSDGPGAAWEGFLMVREPNRCIPGLEGEKEQGSRVHGRTTYREKSGRTFVVVTSRGSAGHRNPKSREGGSQARGDPEVKCRSVI